MRSLSLAASLAALFVISPTSFANAASVHYSGAVSPSSAQPRSSSPSTNYSPVSEPVPANCIRQECGKLWCWQMKNEKTSSR